MPAEKVLEHTVNSIPLASGAGDKLAKDSANDYDQKMTVKTKSGGYWTVSSDSKVFPWSVTYKLGEEFEWDMGGVPGMPEGVDLKLGSVQQSCLSSQLVFHC